MLRWLDRFAACFVVLLAVGVLLACWMPAYVGVDENQPRLRRERPNAKRAAGPPSEPIR